MASSNQYKRKNKWVVSFMAFAFFWLVCGDLITLHQKAIYGFDPFSRETPFAKTNNSSSKTKTDKVAQFDKFKDQYHFDAVTFEEEKLNSSLEGTKIEFNNAFSIFLSQSGYSLITLRGPPIS